MSRIGIKPAGNGDDRAPHEPASSREEDRSKDDFFRRTAELAETMIARHGKDFAMGVLVLSAKFIAEGKPLIKQTGSE
jgi:hypothetical protein